MTFHTLIPAKCIIAGEHTIIQRGFAIVAPFNKYHLSLGFTPDDTPTKNTISGDGYNSMKIILWPVVHRALELLNEDPSKLKGCFDIKSTIPPCGGLGFSAALCVSVAQWAVYYGILPASQLFDFAITLEDKFHGKSSGVDIAGVMSKSIIQYFTTRESIPLNLAWKPNLYVSSSGEHSISERCVKKVMELRKNNEAKANEIDAKMIHSCLMVKKALEMGEEEGLPLLTFGLNLGNECFYDWDLVSPVLHAHIQEVRKNALACKVVGAGFGGHVISLWKDNPKSYPGNDLKINLFSLSYGQDSR